MASKGIRKLRQIGERDALAGKPIEAFYDLPGRHTEAARGEYEIGYREAAKGRNRPGWAKEFTAACEKAAEQMAAHEKKRTTNSTH